MESWDPAPQVLGCLLLLTAATVAYSSEQASGAIAHWNSYVAVRTQPRVKPEPEMGTQMHLIRPFSFFPRPVSCRAEERGACHAIGKRVENGRTRVEIDTVDEIGWKTMIEIIKITLYMYLYNTSLCIRNVNVRFSGSL